MARHLWCSSRSDDTLSLCIDDAPSSVKLEGVSSGRVSWVLFICIPRDPLVYTWQIAQRYLCNSDDRDEGTNGHVQHGQTLIGCTRIRETRTSLPVIDIVGVV